MPALLLAIAAILAAPLSAAPSTRCSRIEFPKSPGRPHILVPTGMVAHSSPSQVAALAVGRTDLSAVSCLELLPPQFPDGPPTSFQSEPWWAVHVNTPLFKVVRGARGSCRANHQIVFVTDVSMRLVSSIGIDQECHIEPYDLAKGR